MYIGNVEITKREIIASISIISIMSLIGVFISSKILEGNVDRNEIYNKAVKIENRDVFEYGMRTNIGNAFVYGDLEAIDTVTYPDIEKGYMFVKRIKERYTRHSRTVTYTTGTGDNKRTRTRTEYYWTWDEIDRESAKCKQISFLGVTFDSGKIELPSPDYIKTVKESSHIRYKYYGTEAKHTGTIFTKLESKTISDNTMFYNGKTIADTVDKLESNVNVGVFWTFWILLISFCVYGFYYFDNEWLE